MDGAFEPQHLLDEGGMRSRSSRSSCWTSGRSAISWTDGAEEPSGRLPARREQVGGDQGDIPNVGHRPVGKGRGRQTGHHVVARLAAALLDVGGEAVVEELQRLVRHLAAVCAGPGIGVLALELGSEHVVIGFGDAEQIGDDEQREGLRVVVDELARAPGVELVDLTIGQLPHELLVLLEALRRDQPQQEPALRGVLRRVERRQLIAERQLIAILAR